MKTLEQKIELIEKVHLIYQNNLQDSKSIVDELSLEQEYVHPIEEQNSKLGYGEITKDGVDSLYQFILSKVDNESSVDFCDIGSGNGKLIMHLGLISNFRSLTGIEINKARTSYCQKIRNSIEQDLKNIFFINDDATNLDLTKYNFVFMNDLLFDESDIKKIISKLKKGTHLISIEKNNLQPSDQLLLSVDWIELLAKYNYYII